MIFQVTLMTDKYCPLKAFTVCDSPLNPSHTAPTQRPCGSYSLVPAFKLTEQCSEYGGEVPILEEGVEFS